MKRAIHTTLAPAGRGPFPQALAAGSLVFVSEQGPLSPQTNHPNAGAFDDQVRQTFANVEAILRADDSAWSTSARSLRTSPTSLYAGVQPGLRATDARANAHASRLSVTWLRGMSRGKRPCRTMARQGPG